MVRLIGGKIILALALLMLGQMFSGCTGLMRYQELKKLDDAGPKETIVVGKFVLIPPLREDEQALGSNYEELYRGKILVVTDDKMRPVNEGIVGHTVSVGDQFKSLHAKLGKFFYVRGPSGTSYFLANYIQTVWQNSSKFSGRREDTTLHRKAVWLPSGMKIDIQPGDKAVYIGTIKYYRNKSFKITKSKVVNEFSQARSEFKKKFGTRIPLVKRIVKFAKKAEKK